MTTVTVREIDYAGDPTRVVERRTFRRRRDAERWAAGRECDVVTIDITPDAAS